MTIKEIPALVCIPGNFAAHCVRCGEHIADFTDPERAEEAIEAAGGRIVVNSYYITDCVAACENCKDHCLCPQCNALLESDVCPDCPSPVDHA